MSVTIKLNLTPSEYNLLSVLDTNLDLNSTQLANLSTYLELAKKIKSSKNTITNHQNIIQAMNYDSDEINSYWIILDKNYNFIDVGIPINGDLSNEKLYEDLSNDDTELIKSLKEFIN